MEIDLNGMFYSTVVWNSQLLKRPYCRPVALYRSSDHGLLGYQIGIFDRAKPPEVEWHGLQSTVMGVLVADLEGWEKAVKEHLGEYIG